MDQGALNNLLGAVRIRCSLSLVCGLKAPQRIGVLVGDVEQSLWVRRGPERRRALEVGDGLCQRPAQVLALVSNSQPAERSMDSRVKASRHAAFTAVTACDNSGMRTASPSSPHLGSAKRNC